MTILPWIAGGILGLLASADAAVAPGRFTANTDALVAEVRARKADMGSPSGRREERLSEAYERALALLESEAPAFEDDLASAARAVGILEHALPGDAPILALIHEVSDRFEADLSRERDCLLRLGQRMLVGRVFYLDVVPTLNRSTKGLARARAARSATVAFRRLRGASRDLLDARSVTAQHFPGVPGRVLGAGESFHISNPLSPFVPNFEPEIVSVEAGSVLFLRASGFDFDLHQFTGEFFRIEFDPSMAPGVPIGVGPGSGLVHASFGTFTGTDSAALTFESSTAATGSVVLSESDFGASKWSGSLEIGWFDGDPHGFLATFRVAGRSSYDLQGNDIARP